MTSTKKIDWVNVLFLTLTPILGVVLLILHLELEKWSWILFILFFLFYFATGFSITAGYHRLFSHRSYEARDWVKFFFLAFGAASFQNSVLKWATDHRKHHRHVDETEDPYSIRRGFFWAHIGWIFFKETEASTDFNNHPDLTKDKLVMWQHKYYLLIAVSVGILLPLALGFLLHAPLGGLALPGFLRVVAVHHGTFFINSLCHTLGKSSFSDSHSAKDSWFVAFFTFGEGYHNFHHCFPLDYRNGIAWYHFDPTKWIIKSLHLMGVAQNLRKVSDIRIFRAKILMDQKTLVKNEQSKEHQILQSIREKLETAHQAFLEKKLEYQNAKKVWKSKSDLKIQELKLSLEIKKSEFKYFKRQWVIYQKMLKQGLFIQQI